MSSEVPIVVPSDSSPHRQQPDQQDISHLDLMRGREESKVVIRASVPKEYESILTREALAFLRELFIKFEPTRKALLRQRELRQQQINNGQFPDFLPETKSIRESDWKVAPIPKDLLDRRVEITGPPNRKMVINALNSGAKVFMADFEDANSPSWENCIEGQINLRDAINRTITFTGPDGKKYALNKETAVLMARPRGWHMIEAHVSIGGEPISASMFDFGLYFFHNAKTLLSKGSGPYFYLPKMESHLEARLWRDIFAFSEQYLGIPHGSIRATVLIETILAAFEMDEILYELREYSAGLNCGRWDYIFSFIKKFYEFKDRVLPDRAQVDMSKHFMTSYVKLLIKTCHRRGIHAMGGMAAQIPIRDDPKANQQALEKVRNDKLREVKAGHDGTWVAHPGLMQTAMEVFNTHMKTPNQIHVIPEVNVTAADLLQVPEGTKTIEGLRGNIRVGMLYIESWLRGAGAAPINNLMEDLATAEISRIQVQNWMKHEVVLTNGEKVDSSLVRRVLDEETEQIKQKIKNKTVDQAKELFSHMFFTNKDQPGEFMSLFAYPYILSYSDSKL